MKHNIYVLDHGFVRVYDDGVYGSDLTVVNAARVSFGKRVHEFRGKDQKLLNYLAKNKHYSPFRHVFVQFHIKMPEFVARQHYKHVVGIETTSTHPVKDHAWNEISGRYVQVSDVYRPDIWRAQSDDNKQASHGEIDNQQFAHEIYDSALKTIMSVYESLLNEGVSREQARMILPLSQYTECYWTASFQSIMNFVELRNHEHAQYEIRLYAKAIGDIIKKEFPYSYNAWVGADL